MFDTIVVAAHGLDRPTRDAIALARALRRAGGGTGPIVLAGAYVVPLVGGAGVYEQALRGQVERDLDGLRSEMPEDLPVQTRAVAGDSVARALHEVAEEHHADLLVLGPTHRSSLGRVTHGDPALGVLRDAPCAVAIAPADLGRAARAPAAIAVGWDESPESVAALEAAVELARAAGGGLHVVRVLEAPYRYVDEPWADPSGSFEWVAASREAAHRSLDNAVARVGERVPVTTDLLEGSIVDRLLEVSDEADLLVLGSRGHGALKRVVLGSTSEALAHRAHASLMLLPRPAQVAAEVPA